MQNYVSWTGSSCFASLRHIRSIRRSVSKPVLMSLVSVMLLTSLHYGSVNLNSITTRLMNSVRLPALGYLDICYVIIIVVDVQ